MFDFDSLFTNKEMEALQPWLDVRVDMLRFRKERLKRFNELGAPGSVEHYEKQVKFRKGRLERLEELGAPDDLVLHENWLLQEAKADLAFLEAHGTLW